MEKGVLGRIVQEWKNEECFDAITMDFPAHSWEKMLLGCCNIMD